MLKQSSNNRCKKTKSPNTTHKASTSNSRNNTTAIRSKKSSITSIQQVSYQKQNIFKDPVFVAKTVASCNNPGKKPKTSKPTTYFSLRSRQSSQVQIRDPLVEKYLQPTKSKSKKKKQQQKFKPKTIANSSSSSIVPSTYQQLRRLNSYGGSSVQSVSRNSQSTNAFQTNTNIYASGIDSWNPSISQDHNIYQTFNYPPQPQIEPRYRTRHERSQSQSQINSDLYSVEYSIPQQPRAGSPTDTYDLLSKYKRQKLSTQTSEYMNTLLSRVKQVIKRSNEADLQNEISRQDQQQRLSKQQQMTRLEKVKTEMRESLVETNLQNVIYRSKSQENNKLVNCVQKFSEKVEQIIQDQRQQRKQEEVAKANEIEKPKRQKKYQTQKKAPNVRLCRENQVVESFKEKIKQVHLFEKQQQKVTNKPNKENQVSVSQKENSIVQSQKISAQKKRRGSLIDMINDYSSSEASNSPIRNLPPWTQEPMLDRLKNIR